MSAVRNLVLVVLVLAAVVLQAAVASQVAILGVVPDLCLLVVVATGLVRGREVGAVTGFLAGLALDLAPPADHVAGRWALAFAVVGFLAGELVRSERFTLDPTSRVQCGGITAFASLVAAVIFQVSGLLVHDRTGGPVDLLGVVGVALVLDTVVAMLLLPPLLDLLGRWRPARLAI